MKRTISLILTTVMLLSAITYSASAENLPFSDVKTSAWYYDEVKTVYEAGIMEGKGNGRFAPSATMTRAELVTVLYRLSGDTADTAKKLTFADTKNGAWYSDAVLWASDKELVTGYPDNTFRPNTPILRQELAKLTVTFLDYMNVTKKGTVLTESFTDAASFPKWAGEYIEKLRETGLMGGDGTGAFKAKSNASRAEIATVITRLLPLMEDDSPVYDIIKDKVSNYTLVYDENDETLSEYVLDTFLDLKLERKVKVSMVKSSMVDTAKGHKIIFGDVAGYADKFKGELDESGDFIIRFVGGDLVVYTNKAELTPYLTKVFEHLVMSNYKDGSLTVAEDFDFVYSTSDIKDLSYIEYSMKMGVLTTDDLLEVFKGYSFTDSKGFEIMYRIYIPLDYSEDKEYPLLVYLHGNTAQGMDNVKHLGTVGHYFDNPNSPAYDSIVLVPQCPEPHWWVGEPIDAVVELMDYVNETYSTDKSRQYVTGISMGGSGTWEVFLNYPDKVSAAIGVAGGGLSVYTKPDGTTGIVDMPEFILDFPLCMAYDTDDELFPVQFADFIYDSIKAAGNDKLIRLRTSGFGHGICGNFVTEDDISLLEWLFAQRRETK